MYQMDYGFGTPKPPRPLIKLEPKAPKPRSRQNTISSPSSRSVSSHGSHSMSITSFATTSSSSSSGLKSRPSMSLPRLFDKLRKHTPSSYPQSPDTPASLSPPFEAETIHPDSATHKDLPVVPVIVAEAPNDNEIVEELREPQLDCVIQTNSRRSSLSSIQPHHASPEQRTVSPHRIESSHPSPRPPRPPRDPKRPKTAPSQRPLPIPPLLPETPSTPTFRPLSRDSSPDERKLSLEFQWPADIARGDSPSPLTRSKSVSHSMMTAVVRPDSPFVDTVPIQSYLAAAVEPWETTTSSSIAARHERRQGWSGEWNVNDMQNVIQKLRELK